MRIRSRLTIAAIILTLFAGSGYASGVRVALQPTHVDVAPGDEFDVRIEVTETGPAYNAYHAIVVYDSQAFTFIDMPASQQEGSAMVSACGSTFHVFVASEGHLDVSHSLLCPGQSLKGPDELYVLRFAANPEPRVSQLTFGEITFADAGSPVPVESAAGTTVRIGNPTDTAAKFSNHLELRVAPNPFNSRTTIYIDSEHASAQSVLVHDVNGRLVNTLQRGTFDPGRRSLAWGAHDDRGQPLPSGVYIVSVRAGAEHLTSRAILLK